MMAMTFEQWMEKLRTDLADQEKRRKALAIRLEKVAERVAVLSAAENAP